MPKITLHNQEVDYALRRSAKAKSVRLTVYSDSRLVVTLPKSAKLELVDKYLRSKAMWIVKKINGFRDSSFHFLSKTSRSDYLKHKETARKLFLEKLERYNKIYGYRYNRVSIKNLKSRWGSCSKKGNLNFNYKIIHLPEILADYIIIHELCHLAELNHSKKFWRLVAKAVPDFEKIRNELRKNYL